MVGFTSEKRRKITPLYLLWGSVVKWNLQFQFSPAYSFSSQQHSEVSAVLRDSWKQNRDCCLWIRGKMRVSNLILHKDKVPLTASSQFSTPSRLALGDSIHSFKHLTWTQLSMRMCLCKTKAAYFFFNVWKQANGHYKNYIALFKLEVLCVCKAKTFVTNSSMWTE